jgi:hypothetical protein
VVVEGGVEVGFNLEVERGGGGVGTGDAEEGGGDDVVI